MSGFESVQVRVQGSPAAVAAFYAAIAPTVVAPSPLNTRALRESTTEVFGRFSAAVAVPDGGTAVTVTVVRGDVVPDGTADRRRSVRGGRRAIEGGRA